MSQKIFGLHAVQAALKNDASRVKSLWVLRNRKDQRLEKVVRAAKSAGLRITLSTRKELDKLVDGERHQGVVAQIEGEAGHDESYLHNLLPLLDHAPLFLVLDGVTDPHNVGACMRTAEAAGVDAVIAPRDRAAGLTAVARKVASGSAERVPFVQVTNLARTLRDLQEQGVWVVGAAGGTDQSIYDAPFVRPTALVMGAEGKGMRRLTEEVCDQVIAIPMQGEVESLNVSVAAAVCLYEAVRQRARQSFLGIEA